MSFLLLIAGLVAAVWGGLLFFRGGLVAGGLLVLLAGCCFGHPFFHIDFSPVPITADRVLFAVLILQLVLLWRWGRLEPLALGKAEIVLAVLLAILAGSTLTHDWHVKHSQPLSRLLFYYLMPAGMYLVGRGARQTEQTARLVFGCLGLFGLYLAVTAIAERQELWWLVWPSYIGSSEFEEFLGRGRGPLLNPAGCGMLQSICLCAGLMAWPRLGPLGRVGLVCWAAVMCMGIYCTLTRSAWMGGVLALGTVLALTLPRNWRLPILGGAAVIGCLLVATQWERLVSFKRDRQLTATDTAESARLRPLLATVAWKMFLDRPLLGCGFGQYMQENSDYVEDRSLDMPLPKARPYVQHNVWLNLLTETGLAGMLTFSALLALWAINAWRIQHDGAAIGWVRAEALLLLAVLAAYGVNAMFQDVSLIPMVHMVVFFLAGLSEGLRRHALPAPAAARLLVASERLSPAPG